jgi:hypothetical protein
MRIQYGPDAAPVELQMVRINSLNTTAELDDSGTDYLYTRVELDCDFQWSPFATASNSAAAAAGAAAGSAAGAAAYVAAFAASGGNVAVAVAAYNAAYGAAFAANANAVPPLDGPGLSLRTLERTLNRPQQVLRLSIGPDLVWEVPGKDANGVRLPCDPNSGPIPKLLSLSKIEGDCLAAGRWKITFWVTGSSQLLLSNRWTVTADTGANGMTRRVIEGNAVARADAMQLSAAAGVDDWRRWWFCPVPSGFRRERPLIKVNETNTRAFYRVIDVQDPNPMGANGAGIQAVKFTGEATAGTTSPIKTHKDSIGNAVWKAALGPLGWKWDTGTPLGNVLEADMQGVLPQNISTMWVKAEGGKTVDKLQLSKLCVGIIMDRFPGSSIVSAVATQGVGSGEQDGRWVKVAMVLLPNLRNFADTVENPTAFKVNFSNDIQPQDPLGNPIAPKFPGDMPLDETNPTYKNWNMPAGVRPGDNSGSRGSWLGALLTQSLSGQGRPPNVPPANRIATLADLV